MDWEQVRYLKNLKWSYEIKTETTRLKLQIPSSETYPPRCLLHGRREKLRASPMLRSFPSNSFRTNRFYGINKPQFDKPVLRGSHRNRPCLMTLSAVTEQLRRTRNQKLHGTRFLKSEQSSIRLYSEPVIRLFKLTEFRGHLWLELPCRSIRRRILGRSIRLQAMSGKRWMLGMDRFKI